MKIKMVTGYAIRTLLYIAQKGGIVPKSEICSVMNIPGSYFDKMVKILKNGGILTNHMGSQGGFALKAAPEDISLFRVYALTEGIFDSKKCLMCDSRCKIDASDECPLRKIAEDISGNVTKILSENTIASLLENDQMKYYFVRIADEKSRARK